MLHSHKQWVVVNKEEDLPELEQPVLALVEHDTELDNDLPFVEELILECVEDFFRWRLLNFNPKIQEEYLQQYLTVIAWRYV